MIPRDLGRAARDGNAQYVLAQLATHGFDVNAQVEGGGATIGRMTLLRAAAVKSVRDTSPSLARFLTWEPTRISSATLLGCRRCIMQSMALVKPIMRWCYSYLTLVQIFI